MVCLGVEPGAAGWKAVTNPLSYGGTPIAFHFTYLTGSRINHIDKYDTTPKRNFAHAQRRKEKLYNSNNVNKTFFSSAENCSKIRFTK